MRWLGWISRQASRVSSLAIVVAAWLVLVAYAYPGYMNWDAGEQLFEARTGSYGDWHPPLMAAYWRVLELVIRGPLPMLLLQTVLFVGALHAIVSRWLAPRAAAIVTALLVLFPPITTTMAVVWKDAQMAAFLLAGVVLATREGRVRRILGLLLLLLAVGVRDNAILATPPLALLIAHSWHIDRVWKRLAVAIAICIGVLVGATAVNRALADRHEYPWYGSIAIHDIAGTLCMERPMTDDEIRRELPGVDILVKTDLQANMCKQYTPRTYLPLIFGGNDIFVAHPAKAERLARRAAWQRMIVDHTGAWLSHRWAALEEVLGLSAAPLWEPVCQSFQPNLDHQSDLEYATTSSWFQNKAGRVFAALSRTLLFRPWLYALLALLMLPYALRMRDWWAVALLASGLLYEAGYFAAAPGPDYRYSHWMVTCTCVALVAVFLHRLRRGTVRGRSSTISTR